MLNSTVHFSQLSMQNTPSKPYISSNPQTSISINNFSLTRGRTYNKRRPRSVKKLPENIKKKIQQHNAECNKINYEIGKQLKDNQENVKYKTKEDFQKCAPSSVRCVEEEVFRSFQASIFDTGIPPYEYVISSKEVNCNNIHDLNWKTQDVKNLFHIGEKTNKNNRNDINKCTKINLKQEYTLKSFKKCAPNNAENEICDLIPIPKNIAKVARSKKSHYQYCATLKKKENGEIVQAETGSSCIII